MLEATACSTCLPGRIELDFERDYSCNFDFSMWGKVLVVWNRCIQLSGRNTCT
jgi:hypothetical protein